MKKNILLACACILLQCIVSAQTTIPPTLSIQGILRKANGAAAPNGEYAITFRLYKSENAPISEKIWQEVQLGVEVENGIYTTVLGKINTLDVPFDVPYFLGVSIGAGSTNEMFPRTALSTAPYALSLRGINNSFPSVGTVRADSVVVATNLAVGTDFPTTHSVVAQGGYLAREGAPGTNGANNNGYSFIHDKESGLFSTEVDKVALYTDKQERLVVTNTMVDVNAPMDVDGDMTVNGNVNLSAGKSIKHNGLRQWTLIDVDDFETDYEGWDAFTDFLSTDLSSKQRAQLPDVLDSPEGSFSGGSWLISPTNKGVLRKQLNLAGIPHDYVKVVFTYYFFDSWDDEYGGGGFINSVFDTAKNGWFQKYDKDDSAKFFKRLNMNLPGTNGDGEDQQDTYIRAEMSIKDSANIIYVYFSSNLGSSFGDEAFGISNIEIWVR